MIVFYWLIAIMPLDEHPFWGRPLVGTFTLIKLLGIVVLLVVAWRVGTGRYYSLWGTAQARWFTALAALLSTSYFSHQGQLVNTGVGYSHILSMVSLFLAVAILVDSPVRLNRTLLTGMFAVGFASLYTIRQQQKYGDIAGFRPSGMLNDSNEYALVVALWMPLAFLWARSGRPKWERLLCGGCLVAALLGTTFAASRGGFLGMAVAFGYLILRSRRPVRNFAIIAALLVPLLLLAPSSPLHRFRDPNTGDKLAERARLVTWTAGLRMVAAHPLIGIGLHNFKPRVAEYELPDENVITLAHNTYIELAAEVGVLGFIFFAGVLVTAFISLERLRRYPKVRINGHYMNIVLGLQAGLLSYFISAVFVTAWWEKLFWLAVFVTIPANRILCGPVLKPVRKKDRSLQERHTGYERRPIDLYR